MPPEDITIAQILAQAVGFDRKLITFGPAEFQSIVYDEVT